MAKVNWDKNKSPASEAMTALRMQMALCLKSKFHVKIANDDGGSHIELWIERKDPNERLETKILDVLPPPKFMGWRLITIKCRIGWIEHVIDKK